MSDTPETDEAVKASNGQWSFVLKETCQRLERERDEYRKQLTAVVTTEWAQQLERERDEAREALRRIVNCSANARRVEADYAEWEKAMFAILEICKEWEEAAK